MTTPPSAPDEDAAELLSLKLKEERAHDAELIRQEFIKSQRLNIPPTTKQEPKRESNPNER